MILLGTIVRLQIQLAPLKQGEGKARVYRPDGILAVPTLDVAPAGVTAELDGRHVLDAHHPAHPRSRNRGDNGVSVGFTGHYDAMRARNGDRAADGVAGENILVAHDGIVAPADIAAGLAIETAAGLLLLDQVIPAPPCAEFSRWVMSYPEGVPPDRSVTGTLQFLGDGMRGFYAVAAGPARIAIGDRVFARMAGE